MKNDRQNQLLQIISEEIIETQEQLLERLQAKGIKSTQATISRDIKELHLIKEPAGQGRYRYAVSAHRTKLNFADKLRTIFRESVTDGGQRPEYRGHQDPSGPGQRRRLRRGRHGRAVSGGVSGRRRHGPADHAGHGERAWTSRKRSRKCCADAGHGADIGGIRRCCNCSTLRISPSSSAADIEFRPGFNALTGETGAGKSIVIDAISAVLGQRTSRDLIRTGANMAFVSACFTGHSAPAGGGPGHCLDEEGAAFAAGDPRRRQERLPGQRTPRHRYPAAAPWAAAC